MGRREHRDDRRIRPLEELVDDLDLVRSRPQACERIHKPLEAVVILDHLLGVRALERIRLEIDDERALPEMQDVLESVEHDGVVLEGEGLFPSRSFEAG